MRTIPSLAAATLCLGVLGSCADDAPQAEEADYVVLEDNGTDDTDMKASRMAQCTWSPVPRKAGPLRA